jgi:hypothetical protein
MLRAALGGAPKGLGSSVHSWGRLQTVLAKVSGHDLELVGRHLAALAVGDEFEGNLVALAQLADACPLDGADMHEGVLTAAIGRDEAKAFFGIKPLYGSLRHGNPFLDGPKMLASVDAVGRKRILEQLECGDIE